MGLQSSNGFIRKAHLGLVTAGEGLTIILPRLWRADGTVPLMVYCPALSFGAVNVSLWTPAYAAAKAGFPVVCGDIDEPVNPYGSGGGQGSWIYDTGQTKLAALISWAQDPTGQIRAKTGKIVIHGGSQGGGTALRYAHDNPNSVDSVVVSVPLCDLQDARANDRTINARALIEAKWGLTTTSPGQTNTPDTVPSRGRCVSFATDWPVSVPIRHYYSDGDEICVLSTQQAFMSALPVGTDIVSTDIGNFSHGASFGAMAPYWNEISSYTLSRLKALI